MENFQEEEFGFDSDPISSDMGFETEFDEPKVPIDMYQDSESEEDEIDEGDQDWLTGFLLSEEERRGTRLNPSIWWIAKEIGAEPEKIKELIRMKKEGVPLYRTVYVSKRNGKQREIQIPVPSLKIVQKKINRHLFSSLMPIKNVCGFSKGSIVDAIKPHLAAKSLLAVDIKDAFPSVTEDDIFYCLRLTEKGIVFNTDNCWNMNPGERKKFSSRGLFSWYAAWILSDLCSCGGRLPQGAPTSPKLFDLVMWKIDVMLARLAEQVGGNYTRYADNIYFSLAQKEFPDPIRNAILRYIQGRNVPTGFKWHKLRIRTVRDSVRMLGLNIIDGEIHNTRRYKRKLRLILHHVQWLIQNGQDYEPTWHQLSGMMAFARWDTLPKGLVEEFKILREEV